VEKRNGMMQKFTHILQQLLMIGEAPSICIHFGGVTPFKTQVISYIPLFEGQIVAYPLEKWLNLLLSSNFVDIENITFMLLKVLPHVNDSWESYSQRHNGDGSITFRI